MGPIGHELRRERPQAGLTLIEVLISTLIISLVVGAAATGIIVMTRSSAAANSAARANVLATGVGEVLKRVDYVECTRGDLEGEYQDLFDQSQVALAAGTQLLKADESAVIDTVEVDCTPVDPGVQNISFTVTTASGLPQEQTRKVEIVKRDPDYADALIADFEACLITAIVPPPSSPPPPSCSDGDIPGATGDAIAIFELNASGSSPQARIVEYAYDCDNGGGVLRTTVATDPNVTCEYVAESTSYTRTITLTITDSSGRTRSAEREIRVPVVQETRLAPTAVISTSGTGDYAVVTNATTCAPNSTPCGTGTANPNLTVTFSGAGSFSLQGTITKYEWDFGDPNSGAANTATTTTATSVPHVFSRSCTCRVRLTVTDDAQKTGFKDFFIKVTRPGDPPPIATFTPSPTRSVAPQTVTFNPTGSQAANGGPVTSYLWDFGVSGAPLSTQTTPSYRYTNAGTYTVTLTVTAGGLQASTTRQVVIEPFVSIPPDFRLAGSKGLFGADLVVRGYFDFAWRNVPRSSGDVVDYEISMEHVSSGINILCLANFGPRQFRVRANDSTTQTYRYAPPSPSRVCLGHTYRWQVRSHRTSPTEGTITSAWTPWAQHTVRDT